MIRETLATNLSRERKRAGLTQEQLASTSGVPRLTISSIEGAKQEPRITTLDSFAVALGVHVNLLLSDLPGQAENGQRDAEATAVRDA